MTQEIKGDGLPGGVGPHPEDGATLRASENCVGCGCCLELAPGIGPYCPNKNCDRVDDQQPHPPTPERTER